MTVVFAGSDEDPQLPREAVGVHTIEGTGQRRFSQVFVGSLRNEASEYKGAPTTGHGTGYSKKSSVKRLAKPGALTKTAALTKAAAFKKVAPVKPTRRFSTMYSLKARVPIVESATSTSASAPAAGLITGSADSDGLTAATEAAEESDDDNSLDRPDDNYSPIEVIEREARREARRAAREEKEKEAERNKYREEYRAFMQG